MRLGLLRRNFHYFSTVAIISCCYVLLLRTSTKSGDDDIHPGPHLSFSDVKTNDLIIVERPGDIQVLPQSAPPVTEEYVDKSELIFTPTIKKIEKLPRIGPPSMEPNKTLNWLDLWSNDTICNQFTVHLLEENLLPRALVSFPGSGNTWLRMLLMGVTGLYVDTIYPGDEFFISKAGSKYELKKDCNCSLLQKTHDLSLFSVVYNMAMANKSSEKRLNQEVEHFRGDGILVIRNPFKAILSYRNFAFGGNMAGLAPVEAFKQGIEPVKIGNRKISTWDQFISRSVASWEMLATVWIRGLKRGGVVYYEKLRRDTGPQLLRMAEMLGIPDVNKDRLECVLRHNQDNSFKRSESGPKNYPKNPFTESQHLLILKSIQSVQLALKERGLDPLPVELYDFYTPMYQYGHWNISSL
ncbi:WSC domain-containing protein 2-like [Daphnia pulicaria]|uniref:WSC domain-containing protein 2-like n=1 Tax=Daphnia pulicaria TaxID=35523 RepID=UPI001EEC165F|nr:WSC domain-containing protein 2-like [Daphnia pulicaria]